jgi:hypothetical protein
LFEDGHLLGNEVAVGNEIVVPGRLRLLRLLRRERRTDDRHVVGLQVTGSVRLLEEAKHGEHFVVFGQLRARRRGCGSSERIHGGEHGDDLAAVDSALGVDLIEQGLVGHLVVAGIDVDDVTYCGYVSVGNSDLDRAGCYSLFRRRARTGRGGQFHSDAKEQKCGERRRGLTHWVLSSFQCCNLYGDSDRPRRIYAPP